MEKAGVPDVKGVWLTVSGGSRLMMCVSIKQRYPGHAKQAAVIASQCHAGAYLGRFVVVVDDDIDPSNTDDMIWAMSTRCEPEEDIDILRRCWSGPLDPVIHPTKKGFNSRAIIDATRPYEWMKDFPPVAESAKEVLDATAKKWGAELFGLTARNKPAADYFCLRKGKSMIVGLPFFRYRLVPQRLTVSLRVSIVFSRSLKSYENQNPFGRDGQPYCRRRSGRAAGISS